jgi:hypothetical protein
MMSDPDPTKAPASKRRKRERKPDPVDALPFVKDDGRSHNHWAPTSTGNDEQDYLLGLKYVDDALDCGPERRRLLPSELHHHGHAAKLRDRYRRQNSAPKRSPKTLWTRSSRTNKPLCVGSRSVSQRLLRAPTDVEEKRITQGPAARRLRHALL